MAATSSAGVGIITDLVRGVLEGEGAVAVRQEVYMRSVRNISTQGASAGRKALRAPALSAVHLPHHITF